ncbi:rRNA-processing protein utp21 [Mycoemilia scoparia]|uniref:rRNA-processing protein utp21 n=1 Tax=Mycoemilia scoparia TaxID=417184 RepID=A0A9W8A4Y4_9FUNG|nr:rRNA-processing protein utp21 [Mycoemilia scoparia]
MTEERAKRSKKDGLSKDIKVVSGSRLFAPFRTLGYVSSEIPHSIQVRGQTAFLTTSIGKSFHVYDVDSLNLLFVGPHFYENIASVISHGDHTFVGCSNGKVVVCHRGKKIGELESASSSPVRSLIVFGEHLVGYTEDNRVVVWNMASKEVHIELTFSEKFHVSTVLHPSTYLNKVLVGSVEGNLLICNISTGKHVYETKSFGSPIITLEQAPVVDVVAVGLLDGRIILHNIKLDETLLTLHQEGKVTAVTFRTDELPIMATASAEGDISIWDLDERRLIHVMRGAHDGLIPSIDFLSKQPILISSGADNAIKEWIFDSLDHVPRLLRQRSGHYGPPQMIRYYGEDGKTILSAGRDQTFRYFSVVRDSQSVEMSQGSLEHRAKVKRMNVKDLRLPCITKFAADPAKQKDWDNILTCHANDPRVFTWSIRRKAIGNHTITLQDNAHPKALAISACGNFGFIGTSTGLVQSINMQSGLKRSAFRGHTKTVIAIQCDRVNHFIYTSSLDKTIKIWDFATGKLVSSIDLPAAASSLFLHRDSDLLAAICDDMVIRIIDTESHKIVRRFVGHENRISDLTFSPDGRWIVSVSLDGTVRTWDLPTGHMVDGFRVPSIPISVSFSPTGDFLVTALMDSPGLYLWANRTKFENIDLQPIGEDELSSAALPTSEIGVEESGDNDDTSNSEASVPDSKEVAGITNMYLVPEKLTENMVTLSSQPKSKWQTLLNLDIIKKRNKPTEAPKAPERAPFFLQAGSEPKGTIFDDNETGLDGDERADETNEKSKGSLLAMKTDLSILLERAKTDREYDKVLKYLQELNPTKVDYELRSLHIDGDFLCFINFLKVLQYQLAQKRDFELVQVYLNVFLKIHSDIITNNPEAFSDLLDILQKQYQSEWKRVDSLIRYSACMVDFCRSTR